MDNVSYPRPRRRTKTAIWVSLATSLVMIAFSGWMFMLAVGIVHHEWIRACPTIGFGWAVLLAVLVRGGLLINSQMQRSDR